MKMTPSMRSNFFFPKVKMVMKTQMAANSAIR